MIARVEVTYGLDGHTRAVERKGEQRVLPPIPLELRPEYCLREAEGVSKVEVAVRVRVRERHDELLVGRSVLRLVGWVGLEGLLPLPQGLDLELGRAKCVSLCRALGGGHVQIGHFGRRGIGHNSVVAQVNGGNWLVLLGSWLPQHSSVGDRQSTTRGLGLSSLLEPFVLCPWTGLVTRGAKRTAPAFCSGKKRHNNPVWSVLIEVS